MDERHFKDLSGAVSLGFLAEDVVFATGQILRGQAVGQDGRQALTNAQNLLQAVANPERGLILGSERKRLAAHRRGANVVEAALQPPVDQGVQQYAAGLAAVVAAALNGGLDEEQRTQLESVRELFANLTRTSLADVNTLSRRRRERRLWPASIKTSLS